MLLAPTWLILGLLPLPVLLEDNCCDKEQRKISSLKVVDALHQQPLGVEMGGNPQYHAGELETDVSTVKPPHETAALADTMALAWERPGGNGTHLSRSLTHRN